ncbi:protein of unknown function [Bacillus sp. cl95]|nr:protein of unknown function [Bacillus sp. UNCCL13]SFQ66444.1 protein of unknown function [Bacillus sp. cl95]
MVNLILLLFFITACSSVDNSGSKTEGRSSDSIMKDDSGESKANTSDSVAMSEESSKKEETSIEQANVNNRMVIYEAQLHLRVKNFAGTLTSFEQMTKKYSGYLVESDVVKEEETVSGTMTIRIPNEYFQEFLNAVEGEAAEILQRNVNGKDVTEEFVDLESRLKSKRVVEARLLDFMKTAEKTEDLLQISSDLATVQEEIEQIVGKMNYLKNQTAFSTITITFFENELTVPKLDNKELNTWERTKKQFVTSLNWLISFISGIVVFFVGNLPVIIVFTLIVIVVYLFIKKRKRNYKTPS